jgi:hypothetical protein
MGAVLIAALCLGGTGLILAGMCLAGDTPDLHDVWEENE